jgi:hypothetical protein
MLMIFLSVIVSSSAIAMVKYIFHDKFSMTDMGPLHFFLGLAITWDDYGIKIS